MSLAEIQDPLIRLVQFLVDLSSQFVIYLMFVPWDASINVTLQLLISFPQMRQPGKLVGVDEMVSGLSICLTNLIMRRAGLTSVDEMVSGLERLGESLLCRSNDLKKCCL